MTEFNHQCTTVEWFKLQYPQYADCIWATINEGQLRGTIGQRFGQAKKLKKMGLKSGVSDLFIAVARGPYHGMFLELKDQGKTYCSVTKPQRAHIELMLKMDYHADWAPGADIAIRKIKAYMDLLY